MFGLLVLFSGVIVFLLRAVDSDSAPPKSRALPQASLVAPIANKIARLANTCEG
jgi:hypothetical protein